MASWWRLESSKKSLADDSSNEDAVASVTGAHSLTLKENTSVHRSCTPKGDTLGDPKIVYQSGP